MKSRYETDKDNQKIKCVSFRMPMELFNKVLEHHLSIASVCREALEKRVEWLEKNKVLEEK